jgi:hypothetical protein
MSLEDPPAGHGTTDEGLFPPEFNDEWTMPRNGRRRPTADRGTNDFPDVGEIPIPNVSPMTAHVTSLNTLLMTSIISPFSAISVLSSMLSSQRGQIPVRRLDWFSNS